METIAKASNNKRAKNNNDKTKEQGRWLQLLLLLLLLQDLATVPCLHSNLLASPQCVDDGFFDRLTDDSGSLTFSFFRFLFVLLVWANEPGD